MRFRTVGLCALTLAVVSCNSPTNTRLGALTIVTGNAQTDSIGERLPLPLIVKLADASGNPVPGATIQWSVKNGGGVVSPSSSTISADGTTQADWTLGEVAMESDTVTAQIAGASGRPESKVTFTARVLSGRTVSFIIVGGNQQTGEIGEPLPESLAVKAVDSHGNGVDSALVTWDREGLGYYLPSTHTLATGISRLQWTMSHQPRRDSLFVCTLAASGTTTDCVWFRATATATPPYTLSLVSGGGQSAVASIPLPADIVVEVKDAVGQPVGGVPVTYHAVAGNAVYRIPRYLVDDRPTTLSTDSVDSWTTAGDSVTSGYYNLLPGQSEITWAAGIGASTLTVTAPSASTVTIPATGLAFTTTALSLQGSDCALGTTGTAYCWGHSQFAADSFNLYPTPVPGAPAFASLGNADASGVCAITSAGVGYCWGAQVPQPPTAEGVFAFTIQPPTAISSPALTQIVQGSGLAFRSGYYARAAHRCLLSTAGAALCYGQNYSGEVGDGMPTPGDTIVTSPTPVVGGLTFVALAAGSSHTCGVATGGAVYCWGSDAAGQLGDGEPASQQASPVLVPGIAASTIVADNNSTCALATGGAAYCWGDGEAGQLGIGYDNRQSTTPSAVVTSARFVALTMHGGTTCGLTASGAVYCWGTFGPSVAPSTAYVPQGLGNVIPLTTISTDGTTVCGLTASNAAMCAGLVEYAGDGFLAYLWSSQPLAVAPPGFTLPDNYALSRVHPLARAGSSHRTRGRSVSH